MKKENENAVRFLYASALGRGMLKLMLKHHIDRPIIRFLRSGWSRPYMVWYAKTHRVPIPWKELLQYPSFRDFFARGRTLTVIDLVPEHLASPCDSRLSVYPITAHSSFAIKGSHYRVEDLLEDRELAKNYEGGTCLLIRLCAADNHHYHFIDDGYQAKTHTIPGVLHSVQPIACETYPVYTLNRRCWCLMATENFGPVVQTEIGAMIVGGIVNTEDGGRVRRGFEKGHFELAGSTIVLLFEPGRIALRPEIEAKLKGDREIRVGYGDWIASGCGR